MPTSRGALPLLRLAALEESRREDAGSVARVPAPEIEQPVLGALADSGAGSEPVASDAARLAICVSRVEVHPDRLILRRVPAGPDQPSPEDLIGACRKCGRGRRIGRIGLVFRLC